MKRTAFYTERERDREEFIKEAGRVARAVIYTMGFALLCCFMYSCMNGTAQASEDWTDEEIVNAIYLAEGGKKASVPYGIKSIKCETEKECRQICKNTVKNNRTRFAHSAKPGESYLEFLSKRYCPVGAKNDPTGLNKNWLKNVRYFLAKNRGAK